MAKIELQQELAELGARVLACGLAIEFQEMALLWLGHQGAYIAVARDMLRLLCAKYELLTNDRMLLLQRLGRGYPVGADKAPRSRRAFGEVSLRAGDFIVEVAAGRWRAQCAAAARRRAGPLRRDHRPDLWWRPNAALDAAIHPFAMQQLLFADRIALASPVLDLNDDE